MTVAKPRSELTIEIPDGNMRGPSFAILKSFRQVALMLSFFNALFSYDDRVFSTLSDKCKRETRFGRFANFAINFLFFALRPVKHYRVRAEHYLRATKSGVRTFLKGLTSSGLPPQFPVQPWEKPLTELSVGLNGREILIIAELSIAQCRKYRVQQKVEALARMGIVCRVASFTDMEECERQIPLSAYVIFYRTPYLPAVQTYITHARRLGIPVLYDIDDLVFDRAEYEKHPVFTGMSHKEKSGFLHGADLYRQCLEACENGIASTPTLADYMRKYARGQVFVIENGLDTMLLRVGERMIARACRSERVTIGYGSGTTSHDHDFAVATPALVRIMTDFPQVHLAIHGHLQLPSDFDQFAGRVHRVGFLEAEDYYGAVGGFSVNLAPLAPGPFNDAKSNIKYLEAAICGVPTVASNAAAFRQEIENGVNGYLAETTDEWYSALSRLIQDRSARALMGTKARESVLARYHPEKIASDLVHVFSSVAPQNGRLLAGVSDKPVLLLVNTLFSPYRFGGATIVVEELARHLQQRWRVIICTSNRLAHLPDGGIARYETDGIPVFSVKVTPEDDELGAFDSSLNRAVFARILANVKPGVVHIHSIQGLGAGIAEECKNLGIPVAITMHDAWWVCARQFMLKPDGKGCFQEDIDLRICAQCTSHASMVFKRSRILQDILAKVDLIMSPSERHRQLMQRNLPQKVSVVVNKNGIHLPEKVLPRTIGAGGAVRIAYLGGGNAEHKGYYFLQRVISRLKQTNYELILVDIHRTMGGNGIDARDWKVSGQLRIVPPYNSSSIDQFFEGVDVLLFPSQIHESFGLSVREALARNTWVISSDTGGVAEEIIENVNGNVVPIGDENALGQAIDRILSAPHKLEGYENPQRSRLRSFQKQADELDDMLRQHLQSPTSKTISTAENYGN